MLRSLDHVARSARRRAEARAGGRIERPGLDVEAWIERARDRFLAAYAVTLERTGAPIVVDLDLLDAFEVAKEAYEFEYAATVLPSWLWAPRDGMRWLLAKRRIRVTEAVRPEGEPPPEVEAEDRAETLREDILAGPDELAAVLDRHARAVAALPAEVFEHPRWRLIGMGSSRFAALDAAARLRAAGLDAAAELASASSPSEPRAGTVAVLISNSGSTPEVLAAAERHRAGSFVIALTGDPSAPLASHADAVMPLVAERARSGGDRDPLLSVDGRGPGDARRSRRGPDARCRAPGRGAGARGPARRSRRVAVGRGRRARRWVARSTCSATGRGSAWSSRRR